MPVFHYSQSEEKERCCDSGARALKASKVLCASSSGYSGKREGGNKKRKKKLGLKILYTILQAVKLGIRY